MLLRKIFFVPMLGSSKGGTVIGRNVVLRHPDKIHFGANVVVDDNAVIDARGSGDDGIVIGDNCFIGRGAMIQSKYGPVTIGNNSSVGSHAVVISIGKIKIGDNVMVAGGTYIGGGMYHTERTDIPISEQGMYTRGPITIGDGTWFGMSGTVIDGVKIGQGCIIGAGAVVTRSVPDLGVAVGVPARLIKTRKSTARKA